MWPLFLPKQYRNSLHLPSPWQEGHAYYLLCPIFLPLSLPDCFPPFNTKILSFFLSLQVISWLLVWSHRKYFQDSITVPKSLHSLPGGKQNSHLRFSCGAFSANIIPDRSPPSAGSKQLTFQSPFSHTAPFLFFCKICKLKVISVYLSKHANPALDCVSNTLLLLWFSSKPYSVLPHHGPDFSSPPAHHFSLPCLHPSFDTAALKG